MRFWNSFFEMLQFPVKVLFVAFILLGLGDALANPAIVTLLSIGETTLTISAGLRYVGAFVINNFPLLIVIKMVGRRQDSSVPVFAGVLGYFVFVIGCAFIAPQTYGSEFYASILGIQINMIEFGLVGEKALLPFQTGIIAAGVVVWMTRIAYRNTRLHTADGFLGYVDRDTLSVLLTMILCFVACVAVTMLWPLAIKLIAYAMRLIAGDITSPVNLFIYGILDRLMAMGGLGSIIHNAFWFGSYGGSWMNASEVSFFGDVNIWTAQQSALIVSNGAGRLITPYYLLNFFAVPATTIAIWLLHTDPVEKRRYFTFMILVIIMSICFGSTLPFELFLFITTPFIFLVHLVTTGLLFGILQSIGVFIGYTYHGSLSYALPGNLFDLIAYFNDTYTRGNLYTFLIVGAIVFIFYFLFTYFYFNYLALDFVSFGKKDIIDKFVVSVGGLGNIRNIHASTIKINAKVINPQIVNFAILHDTGVGKIVENKDGYNIYFGSDSILIRKEVIKRIRGK